MRAKEPLQALAVDLDGTLVSNVHDFDHPIGEENLAALRDLRRAGTRVLICTGRGLHSARSLLARSGDDELAASDLILQNGALVVEGGSGRLLASWHLPRRDAARLLESYRRHDLDPMLFDNHFRGGACLFEREPRNPRYALYLSLRAREEGLGEHLRRVDRLEDYLDMDPLALGSIDSRDKILAAHEAMEGLRLPDSRVAVQGLIDRPGAPSAHFLEAFHRDVSKENAFREYCSARGYDMAHCGAAGDGRNDLELIRMVGFGIAMGQAGADLHAEADYVAPRYDENGLASAIRECLLP